MLVIYKLVVMSVRNYYELMPNDLKKQSYNPNYSKHGIKVPMRALLCGGSGSGKTNTLLELIHLMSGTFEYIHVCCKSRHEPLYEFLSSKIPEPYLKFYEGINDIPPLDSIKQERELKTSKGRKKEWVPQLVVFDDLVNEKKQGVINDYFIRARKCNISCVYLSQSFFRTPKIIRLNVNYIILMGMASKRDLRLLLGEFVLGPDIDMKELLALYEYATKNKMDFFMVDIDNPDTRLRRGFTEII